MDFTNNEASTPASPSYATDLLYGFDIQDGETYEFLKSLITDGMVPRAELRQVRELAILRGMEEWDMLFACAAAIRDRTPSGDSSDSGLAPYVACLLYGSATSVETAQFGKHGDIGDRHIRRRGLRRRTSQFWQDEGNPPKAMAERVPSKTRPVRGRRGPARALDEQPSAVMLGEPAGSSLEAKELNSPNSLLGTDRQGPADSQDEDALASPSQRWSPLAHYHSPLPKRSRSFKSPFFSPSPAKKEPRPSRGTISRRAFPPLSATRFGLIQESLSHDPFRLLIAVTFLIRTTGRAAVPVFHKVMELFPTPEAFAAAELEKELLPMIAHLGLPVVRCTAIRKYAKIWIERPPQPGVKFLVRGYPRLGTAPTEDVDSADPAGVEAQAVIPETPSSQKRRKSKLNSSEWEIGHLTQGRYAIDSWRIFCRDIFLGKSDNWLGPPAGYEETDGRGSFEPEWMRVLPDDKELRACLRWMWMREGYEWDPVTGEKKPLRDEMRAAVEEGRIKYDNKGELVILERALDSDDDV